MLMTKLKSEEVIGSLTSGKVFIINCHGCKEVGFPEEEAKALQKKLQEEGKVVGINADYITVNQVRDLLRHAPTKTVPVRSYGNLNKRRHKTLPIAHECNSGFVGLLCQIF